MAVDIPLIDCRDEDFRERVEGRRDLLRAPSITYEDIVRDVPEIVEEILTAVAAGGDISRRDAALIELTKRLDKADLAPGEGDGKRRGIRVPAGALKEAHAAADSEYLELMRRAAENVRAYQEHILVSDPPPLTRGCRRLEVRYTPVDSVYVPGGRALYPSSVLMTVVPAQVAGVERIAMVSPPTSDGDVAPLVLALAAELGVKEVYRVGGAQAIAALAFGTETIPAVDKIVGPGNAFVAEAKRRLFGRVGIDSIAGPSEVLIIADDTARPDWVAADMRAQAEHGPGSAVLVTPSRELAEQVRAALDDLRVAGPGPTRRGEIETALAEYSAIIVTSGMDQACEIANEFATEHLQIMTGDDEAVLKRIRHAGAIFVGAETPVPLGDYYAGPSHVLPTGGTARFFGPLSCNDFRKASSVIRYDGESLAADAADVADFAKREGLTAHARAVEIRTDEDGQ